MVPVHSEWDEGAVLIFNWKNDVGAAKAVVFKDMMVTTPGYYAHFENCIRMIVRRTFNRIVSFKTPMKTMFTGLTYEKQWDFHAKKYYLIPGNQPNKLENGDFPVLINLS